MPRKSDNLINRTNPDFWKKKPTSTNVEQNSHNQNNDQPPLQTEKKGTPTVEVQNSQAQFTESENITNITSHKQFSIKKKTTANHLSICETKEPEKQEQTNWHKVWPVATALCLCLAFVPFIKNINPTNNNNIAQAHHPIEKHTSLRGLASEAKKTKLKRLFERYERDSERIMYRLQNGQRKLTSIGRKPSIKDKFSHVLLHSRYKVKWRRHRLRYLNILKEKEPLPNLASIESIIRDYSAIFPKHESIQKKSLGEMDTVQLYAENSYIAKIEKKLKKNGFSIAQMGTYTLKNKGSSVATVAVFTDDKGHLLAMHVQ